MDMVRLNGMEKLGENKDAYERVQAIHAIGGESPSLPQISSFNQTKSINLPLHKDAYDKIQSIRNKQELVDIDIQNIVMDNPKMKTVKEMTEQYSEQKVTAHEIRGLADWLCEKFTFVYIEGLALYLYLDGRYVHFRFDFATRFLTWVFREYGINYPLRSSDFKEIVRLLQAQPQIVKKQEECRTDVTRILYEDGVFVAEKTGRMCRPQPEDYQFSKIDYPLEWDFTYEASDEARNFIERFCSYDDEREAYLWELIGYLLSSYQQKIIVLFVGPSNSGKSTLANMIRRICGTEACIAIGMKELSKDFNIAELQGKKLCIDADMDATTLNARDISLLKKAVGNDLLQGNRKFEPQFYFQCQTKFLICANGKIKFCSDENMEPFFERLKVFELRNSISPEERNRNMEKILDDNRTYFLQQAMKGLLRLVSNNFQFSCNEVPENFVENINKQADLDSVDKFVETCCQCSEDSEETVADLYRAYGKFAKDNGMKSVPMKMFSCHLVNAYGFFRKRTSKVRFLQGIKLVTGDM